MTVYIDLGWLAVSLLGGLAAGVFTFWWMGRKRP